MGESGFPPVDDGDEIVVRRQWNPMNVCAGSWFHL